MARAIARSAREDDPLSQPPYPPYAGPQVGTVPPAPGAPAPAGPAPAAPTQVVFPGQVQLPPQPQYAPTPAQQQPQSFATGFPNYRSPAPSPKNRTGLIVGIIVCLVVIAGAVIGFWLVG
jgi:hypothetical protein